MLIKTYFDKNNTIVRNSVLNTSRNPITEIFYGGGNGNLYHSRFIFFFDESTLLSLVNDNTISDLTKTTHKLKMKNIACFSDDVLGGVACDGKLNASSFDLVLFKIDQFWDEGVGLDFNANKSTLIPTISINNTISTAPSNWFSATTLSGWTEPGVFSGMVTTLATQHFDKGNEDICMDITNAVNDILSGATTNYGFGVAFTGILEKKDTPLVNVVSFFTRHTQTFFEPFVETNYNFTIEDDRNRFYTDKNNKLYLYTNTGGVPTNLDTIPSVDVYDNNGNLFSSYTSSDVVQSTKGVYYIDIVVPSSYNDCAMFLDIWSSLSINGVARQDRQMEFVLKDGNDFFNIGDNDSLPRSFAFSVSGIKREESIKRGDIRKILVSARIPFTIEESDIIDGLFYRLYVKQGNAEIDVIDWERVHITPTHNYLILNTNNFVPQTYFIDFKLESNQEVTTYTETIKFHIVSIVDNNC